MKNFTFLIAFLLSFSLFPLFSTTKDCPSIVTPGVWQGVVEGDLSFTGAVRRVQCNSGFSLTAETAAEIRCRPDGTWSLPGNCYETNLLPSKKQFSTWFFAMIEDDSNVVERILNTGVSIIEARNAMNETGLHIASIHGAINTVRLLLRRGAVIDSTNGRSGDKTPLMAASEYGHDTVAAVLIDAGASVAAKTHDGMTALHLAATYAHTGAVRVLLDGGADPVAPAQSLRLTALMLACFAVDRAAQTETMRLLIQRGGQGLLKAVDSRGRTALHWAAFKGATAAVSLLMDMGLSVDATDNNKATPLLLAVSGGHMRSAARLLRQNSTSTPEAAATAAEIARRSGHSAVAQFLQGAQRSGGSHNSLEITSNQPSVTQAQSCGQVPSVWQGFLEAGLLHVGARRNVRCNEGYTLTNGSAKSAVCRSDRRWTAPGNCYKTNLSAPSAEVLSTWFHAALDDDPSSLEKILNTGVNIIEAKNEKDRTALYLGALAASASVVKLLIARGAMVNSRNGHRGFTPLMAACVTGRTSVAMDLLDAGADVTATEFSSWTALHFAARYGHATLVRLLIDRGAVIEAEDNYFFRPLHLAAWFGKTEAVRNLVELGADMEAQNKKGETPLILACARKGQARTVSLLVGLGANVTARFEGDRTALHKAVRKGTVQALKVLLDNGVDVDVVDGGKVTPLMLAASLGNGQIVKILLDRGANKSLVDASSKSPEELAEAAGHGSVVELVRNYRYTTTTMMADGRFEAKSALEQRSNADGFYLTDWLLFLPLVAVFACS